MFGERATSHALLFNWYGFSGGKPIRSLATQVDIGFLLIPIKFCHSGLSRSSHVKIHRYRSTSCICNITKMLYVSILKGKASIQTWRKHAQYMFQPTIEPQICPKVYVCLSSFVSWSSPASNTSKHPWHHSKSYIRTESSYHPNRTFEKQATINNSIKKKKQHHNNHHHHHNNNKNQNQNQTTTDPPVAIYVYLAMPCQVTHLAYRVEWLGRLGSSPPPRFSVGRMKMFFRMGIFQE